jgi:tetratricopeptide (TPR) repeat protein
VDLYQRLLQRDPDSDDRVDWLVALLVLYEDLGTPAQKSALLPLADQLLQRTKDDHRALIRSAAPVDEWTLHRRATRWARLGRIMRSLGQTDRAKECLDVAVLSYQQAIEVSGTDNAIGMAVKKIPRNDALRELALLHCQTGDWEQAEHCLTRIATDEFKDEARRLGGDDLVLLASIQQHLSRPTDAGANLALAVKKYLADPPTPVPTRAEMSRMLDKAAKEGEEVEDVLEFLALQNKRLALQYYHAWLRPLVDEAEERGRLQEAKGWPTPSCKPRRRRRTAHPETGMWSFCSRTRTASGPPCSVLGASGTTRRWTTPGRRPSIRCWPTSTPARRGGSGCSPSHWPGSGPAWPRRGAPTTLSPLRPGASRPGGGPWNWSPSTATTRIPSPRR